MQRAFGGWMRPDAARDGTVAQANTTAWVPVPVLGPVPCECGVCSCKHTQWGWAFRLRHLPQKMTNQAPNYTRFTHPPTAYLCSLATLEQCFQLSGEEFSAKHQSKKKGIEPVAKSCECRQSAGPLARLAQFWVTPPV